MIQFSLYISDYLLFTLIFSFRKPFPRVFGQIKTLSEQSFLSLDKAGFFCLMDW